MISWSLKGRMGSHLDLCECFGLAAILLVMYGGELIVPPDFTQSFSVICANYHCLVFNLNASPIFKTTHERQSMLNEITLQV